MRLLVLCTHNSARSQMAEGWLRKHATSAGLDVEVWSAGTEATRVKPQAIEVMREVDIDISNNASKSLLDLPDPWKFELVLTVCDSANEACPSYPAHTTRLHVPYPDPTGLELEEWRKVRDQLGQMSQKLVAGLAQAQVPSEEELLGLGQRE